MEDLLMQDTVAKIISHSFPDFNLVSFDLNDGENKAQFLSIINIITARLRSKVGSTEQELQIFLKSIPRNPIKHKMALETQHFKREILMYNFVLPSLRKETGFSSYPTVYYATSDDSNNDFLAMENLKLAGFTTTDRLAGLDWNHLSLTIKTVAELHGCSFSIFKDGKESLKQFPVLVDAFFRGKTENEFCEMGKLCLSNTSVDILEVLKDEGRVDLIPKLNYFLGQYAKENILELVKIPQKFPSVITHGDLWTCNLMFRYSKEESTCPVDMKLLDFQASVIGSRVLDVAYLIYTSASLSVLQTEESIQSMLRLYFEVFSETCQKFNCPLQFASQELSWENFLEEWEAYKNFGLIKAVLLTFLMYSPPDGIPDCEEMVESDMVKDVEVDDSSSIFKKLWKHKFMRMRLIHLIQNFVPSAPDAHK